MRNKIGLFVFNALLEMFSWLLLVITPIIWLSSKIAKFSKELYENKQWIKKVIREDAIKHMRKQGMSEAKINLFK